MTDDISHKISNLWSGLKKRAADAVADTEAGLVRGKIAGKTVVDDAGEVLVEAGHPIDDAVIARAAATGKMHMLVSSAAAAGTQDLRERVREAYEATPEGVEARSMATSDAYVEARQYIGRYVGVDVLDGKGEVLIPAGRRIEDEDVRAVREANQLEALIFAAQQPLPEGFTPTEPQTAVAPKVVSTAGRTAAPLAESFEPEQTGEPRAEERRGL